MDPLDLVLPADGIGQPVQAVADDAVNAFDPGRCQGFGELFRYLCHSLALGKTWSVGVRRA
jgi:hypothetical protein